MNGFEFVGRHLAHDDLDFKFHLDEYRQPSGEQLLLAHLKYERFTPSVWKRTLAAWTNYRKTMTADIYGCPEVDDEKWARFVNKTGWRYLTHITCNNGARRPLYIHRLSCP